MKTTATCVSNEGEVPKEKKVASVSVTNEKGTEYSKIDVDNVGSMVNEIVKKNVQKGTTKIKIEIEITHD